jgi:hypothetical protein
MNRIGPALALLIGPCRALEDQIATVLEILKSQFETSISVESHYEELNLGLGGKTAAFSP